MAKIKIEVDVSKESYEMGLALTKMVAEVKKALDDGWQMGQDLPVIMTAIISNLAETVEGVRSAPEEWKEDPQALLAAVALGMAGIVDAVKD